MSRERADGRWHRRVQVTVYVIMDVYACAYACMSSEECADGRWHTSVQVTPKIIMDVPTYVCMDACVCVCVCMRA